MNDSISRQMAIDEIEYELEMINLALDSITLDFNARERLRQRRGEAIEILNSIQQLPSAERHGHWIMSEGAYARRDGTYCSECGWSWADNIAAIRLHPVLCVIETNFCPNCGAKMDVSDTDVGKMEEVKE